MYRLSKCQWTTLVWSFLSHSPSVYPPCLSICLILYRIRFWHQSVQSSLLFSQCHEGPQHGLRCGRGSGRRPGMKTLSNIYIYTLKETHNNSEHISLSCHHMQLTPPGLCVCMYVCVCVLTNPWFYLCLMLSAVGRHAVQGQLLLLPLTCVLCVF